MLIKTLTPADAAADLADDPAVLRAERRLRILEEMTEIGLRLLRALETGGEAKASEASATGPSGKRRDPVDHYASLTRSLRLTLKLEAETDEALAALKDGLTETRQRQRRLAAWSTPPANARGASRRETVRQCLRVVAERESESEEQLDHFFLAIEQRLAEDPAYADLDAAPLRQILERLCFDLNINPDWTAWTGSGWTCEGLPRHGPQARPRYSRFGHTSSRPIWDDEPLHDLE
ncbi:MAG TPA: hypothetical protein VGF71_10205 [Caulobacteraceae bacterium]